ncbi:hypothetical protein NTG1052_520027 [Candidatus Nitrotoga sp. 1052]|nr:hypothetical protein NTG1052_520027 [Candidatus Nitrotoga sp. 1052]
MFFTCILDSQIAGCFVCNQSIEFKNTHFSWDFILKYQRLLKLNQYVMFLNES